MCIILILSNCRSTVFHLNLEQPCSAWLEIFTHGLTIPISEFCRYALLELVQYFVLYYSNNGKGYIMHGHHAPANIYGETIKGEFCNEIIKAAFNIR